MRWEDENYKWSCPVCDAIGRRISNKFKAMRWGRMHMRRFHDIGDKDPDLIRVGADGEK